MPAYFEVSLYSEWQNHSAALDVPVFCFQNRNLFRFFMYLFNFQVHFQHTRYLTEPVVSSSYWLLWSDMLRIILSELHFNSERYSRIQQLQLTLRPLNVREENSVNWFENRYMLHQHSWIDLLCRLADKSWFLKVL